jgi:hypothetical protein
LHTLPAECVDMAQLHDAILDISGVEIAPAHRLGCLIPAA